jgi:hypothetical protein
MLWSRFYAKWEHGMISIAYAGAGWYNINNQTIYLQEVII